MKRIANDLAVATLLCTIPANKTVRIVDSDHHIWTFNEPWENTGSGCGTEYSVNDILHKTENVKIAKAKIYRTAVSASDGMLVLVIDTKFEEY